MNIFFITLTSIFLYFNYILISIFLYTFNIFNCEKNEFEKNNFKLTTESIRLDYKLMNFSFVFYSIVRYRCICCNIQKKLPTSIIFLFCRLQVYIYFIYMIVYYNIIKFKFIF